MGARVRGEEGTVRLRVRVDGRGHPVEVAVSGSSGYVALDAAAEKAVKGARFVPPRPGAPPESFSAELSIRFQLKD
jgi:protein TonB